ncbi:MAG TPA: DUF2934 domain-containing protein [Isosphaeraceae bacterium]|jgi:hypothetical protein
MAQHNRDRGQPSPGPNRQGTSPASSPPSPEAEPPRTAAATDAPASLERESSPEISSEQIAVRAYEIWIAHGRPEGTDVADWLEAERQLRQGQTGPKGETIPLDPRPLPPGTTSAAARDAGGS